MRVIPAIDIRGGKAVRLVEGDFDRETVYGDDPIKVAAAHLAAGAFHLHVVDLDAAVGRGDNRQVVHRIVAETRLEVQVAGGIRDEEGARAWLDAGASIVVMGTVAVRNPEEFSQVARAFPGRIAAALDLKDGHPAVTGWTATEALNLATVLARWAPLPLAAVILTSVDRDGTLAGPDLVALRRALGVTTQAITYSGGIASLEDLRAVAAEGATAAIVGKAIYEGRFDVATAIGAV